VIGDRLNCRIQENDLQYFNHGNTLSFTDLNIRNGFDLKYKLLDRIYRINKISFDHFPEENGQTLSPSAKVFLTASYLGVLTIAGKYLTCVGGSFYPPKADGVFLVSSGN